MLRGETRMGGTCSIPEHSGPEGTKFSCLDNGGEWTWMASLDACRITPLITFIRTLVLDQTILSYSVLWVMLVLALVL